MLVGDHQERRERAEVLRRAEHHQLNRVGLACVTLLRTGMLQNRPGYLVRDMGGCAAVLI